LVIGTGRKDSTKEEDKFIDDAKAITLQADRTHRLQEQRQTF
jgi:hypothetical protein